MLRKMNKWWKTSFFHMNDIARVNSYILFNEFREKILHCKELERKNRYFQLDFTEELMRNLGNLNLYDDIPFAGKNTRFLKPDMILVFTALKRNCKLRYLAEKKKNCR